MVSVETGVRYPARPFLLNPPAVAGRLSTAAAGDITISGATSDNPDTAEYLAAMPGFETRSLDYRPAYNEYRNAPVSVYEGGVLYNQFDGATIALDEGSIVSGSRINLLAIDGDLDVASQGTASAATYMDVPRGVAQRWARSVSVYNATSSGDEQTVEQVPVSAWVWCKSTSAPVIPSLTALHLAEYIAP